MFVVNTSILLTIFLQLIQIDIVQGYASPLVKICHDESESVCIGMFIRTEWILSSGLCKDVAYENTKIVLGNLQRDCSAGETVKILRKYKLNQQHNVMLFKVESTKNVSIFKLEDNIDNYSICEVYCIHGTSETCGITFQPITTVIVPCKERYNITNSFCLKLSNSQNMSYVTGSPILCDGTMVGYANLLSSQNILALLDISRFNKQINEIMLMDAELAAQRQYNAKSSLVKICQDNPDMSNVCLGVYITPQWVLANKLCNHVYTNSTNIIMGSTERDCKMGQQNIVEKILEINGYDEAVLIKVVVPFILSREVAIIDIDERYESATNCFGYCQENLAEEICEKNINPRPVTLSICTSIANSIQSSIKDKICLRSADDNGLLPSISGSPIICDNKLIGYALSARSGSDYEQMLIPLTNFSDKVTDKIEKDKKGLLEIGEILYDADRVGNEKHLGSGNTLKAIFRNQLSNKRNKGKPGKPGNNGNKNNNKEGNGENYSLRKNLSDLDETVKKLTNMNLKNVKKGGTEALRKQLKIIKEVFNKAESKFKKLLNQNQSDDYDEYD